MLIGPEVVCFYVKKSIACETLLSHTNSTCELLILQLNHPKVVIINLYRPPNCSAIESAEKCLLSLKAPMPNIILMGDLNMPNVDWSNPIATGHQINIYFTNRFFIDQKVDKATKTS